jgi:CRISPR/Cas system CSM-associated protein Csm3 (group 7 of RAMP superfamily)
MNPYNFVRVNWPNGVQRQRVKWHDRYDGLSGRIEGTITALTPLFIPESRHSLHQSRSRDPFKRFITNKAGQHIIPGSSLKGMIRSLVETIGLGCWWLFKGEHGDKLPEPFKQCRNTEHLCIACRMFGLINKGTLLEGHVRFEDAIGESVIPYDPIYTIILSGPKPRHTAFYLDEQNRLAGRKFYYHHTSIKTASHWLPEANTPADKRQNQYIKPIGTNSVFTFSTHFENLAQDELNLLLYALVLEPTMRHKIGQGKPAGLGSVEISLTQLEFIDYRQRYTSPNRGITLYKEGQLKQEIDTRVAGYVNNHQSNTLQDLRDIWRWPGRDDLRYPNNDWFKANPTKRLHETP